jgi:hypothetical protein
MLVCQVTDMDVFDDGYQLSMSVFILSVVCDFAAARGREVSSPAQNVQDDEHELHW